MKNTVLAVLAAGALTTGAAWHGLAADTQKAATITTPMEVACQYVGKPRSSNPVRRTCIVIAPSKTPPTVPLPPNKLAPPSMAAAIISNS